jgi:hypothetical protein
VRHAGMAGRGQLAVIASISNAHLIVCTLLLHGASRHAAAGVYCIRGDASRCVAWRAGAPAELGLAGIASAVRATGRMWHSSPLLPALTASCSLDTAGLSKQRRSTSCATCLRAS